MMTVIVMTVIMMTSITMTVKKDNRPSSNFAVIFF